MQGKPTFSNDKYKFYVIDLMYFMININYYHCMIIKKYLTCVRQGRKFICESSHIKCPIYTLVRKIGTVP